MKYHGSVCYDLIHCTIFFFLCSFLSFCLSSIFFYCHKFYSPKQLTLPLYEHWDVCLSFFYILVNHIGKTQNTNFFFHPTCKPKPKSQCQGLVLFIYFLLVVVVVMFFSLEIDTVLDKQ